MGFRFQGPTGAPGRPRERLDAGTTQPVEHHAPGITDVLTAAGRASPLALLGPMGVGAAGVAFVGQLYYAKNLDALTEVRDRAAVLAPAAIADATGFSDLGKLLDSLLYGLLAAMIALVASTALGGAIGGVVGFFFGGAGAAPGAVVGAKVGLEAGLAILTWLGVGFLAASILGGLGELISLELSAVRRGWAAGDLSGPRRSAEIEAAAQELAKAAGVLIRLILEGILAYLMRGAPMATSRAATATVNQVRSAGSEVVAAETVAAVVKELRSKSKLLGKGFADWVELNWQKLLDNPKLRRYAPEAKAPVGAGVAEAAQTPSQVARDSGARGSASTSSDKPVSGVGSGTSMPRLSSTRNINSAEANEGFGKPPFAADKPVIEGKLAEDTKFVRLYDGENSGQMGRWMMPESEVSGLTPAQIQQKFALPQAPTMVSDVNVPAGTVVRVGEAGSIPGWGSGGGTQIQLMNRIPTSAYTNPRAIP